MLCLEIIRYYIFWVEDSVNYQLGQTNPGNTAPRPFIYISLYKTCFCAQEIFFHTYTQNRYSAVDDDNGNGDE